MCGNELPVAVAEYGYSLAGREVCNLPPVLWGGHELSFTAFKIFGHFRLPGLC